jgi:hypothetical protein
MTEDDYFGLLRQLHRGTYVSISFFTIPFCAGIFLFPFPSLFSKLRADYDIIKYYRKNSAGDFYGSKIFYRHIWLSDE